MIDHPGLVASTSSWSSRSPLQHRSPEQTEPSRMKGVRKPLQRQPCDAPKLALEAKVAEDAKPRRSRN